MSNEPKIAVITGTRKGIGRYLAEYYLKKGLKVFGCSRGDSDLEDSFYHHYNVDVAVENEVIAMIKDVARQAGRIDYLINNAGIAAMNHSFLTPLSVVESIFKTNVFGTFLFCREAGRIMSHNKKGRIVNFTTIATPIKLEGESAYASSKAAVENLTKVLAREFSPFNVTVNAVGPTPIYTDLIKNVPKGKMDALLRMQAIHRFGTFEDVSNVIDFFLSEESNFITGQIVYLGGVIS